MGEQAETEGQDVLSERIRRARDNFYPGWWTYPEHWREEESLKPFYHVRCHGQEELKLATLVKPNSVRAEIVDVLAELEAAQGW